MTGYIVAETSEVPVGSLRLVEVKGREIGVANLSGEFYGVRNRCPHQGGPLCLGNRVGHLTAPVVGVYEHSGAVDMVQCPWHQWEFDLRTGQSWCDPSKLKARKYRVYRHQGAAILHDASPDIEGPGTRVQGPYVAETYQVRVDGDYVVIEM